METFPRAVLRYVWRRRFRRLHDRGLLGRNLAWARDIGIGAGEAERIAALPLGQAIAEAERASPRLVYRPIGPRQLPGQIRVARVGVAAIRLGLVVSSVVQRVWRTVAPGRAITDTRGSRI
jgi:hypothetical protein